MIIKDYIPIDSWLVTIAIALIVYYLIEYVRKIQSYPRGPFPLPIVGNLLRMTLNFLRFSMPRNVKV
jgi:hypothetical protein